MKLLLFFIPYLLKRIAYDFLFVLEYEYRAKTVAKINNHINDGSHDKTKCPGVPAKQISAAHDKQIQKDKMYDRSKAEIKF